MALLNKNLSFLFLVFIVFVVCQAGKTKTHKSKSANHLFRTMNNHLSKKSWFGPFQICSDVTYALYLDTKNSTNVTYSAIVVNNQSKNATTQTWYFRKRNDGNYSIYNPAIDGYLALTPDKTSFVVAPYDRDSEYQKFYVRSFWNGYTFNCQIDQGYYNYVTVSGNGTVKSLHFNGNPYTQFFQLIGNDILTLA